MSSDFTDWGAKLGFAEQSLLKKIKDDFLRVGLGFSDPYVQCVFRGLILKFRYI